MINNSQILVSVNMITYLHGKYIREAIEGVLMQNCNFNFELIIADDCSPDNTSKIVTDIINSHPNGNKIKYFRHEKNIGMHANSDFVINQAKGKYIAICEGDDYWIDPNKLQKQVDFLENNLEYGIVHTNFKNYFQSTNQFKFLSKKKHNIENCYKELILGKYHIGTLTTCFKKELLINFINEIKPSKHNWLMGDLPVWLYFAQNSKFHYIDEISAVYRILEESASQTLNIDKKFKFEESIYEVRMYFWERSFKNDFSLKREILNLLFYNKLLINVYLNGSIFQFICLLLNFHIRNTNFLYFIGSFKQCVNKLKSLKKCKIH
jgi:glycosyltransferase involved in cell wall biosynthesis